MAQAIASMPKRQRLSDLVVSRYKDCLHVGGVSTAGLAKLIAALGCDEESSLGRLRNRLNAANSQTFKHLLATETLRLKSGLDWVWDMLDPGKTLAFLVNESATLQELYRSALARHPSTLAAPWRIVVGYDEFTPGNKLSVNHSRKSMVLSFSFLELGSAALMHGSAWVSCIVVRTTIINQVCRLR